MDDNCNGTFDVAERIMKVIPPVGDTTVDFSWELNYPTNCFEVYLRFRLGTDQNQVMSPFGFAKDGEMEDYIVESSAVLPIELISFDATVVDNKEVHLSWSTASEINSDYFVIERSPDGLNWDFVDEVDAVGSSNTVTEYEAIDRNPERGVNYYNLVQYEIDGTKKTFGPVSAQIIDENKFSVYPNPSTEQIKVRASRGKPTNGNCCGHLW